MATAFISLASSIIGGLLVLAAQWFTRRSEDQRYWRGQLRDAAADLSTSFSQERAIMTSDRAKGKATSQADEVTYLKGRQQALNRLFTLPHGDAFQPQVTRLGHDIEELYMAYPGSDEEWQAARERLRESIRAFNAAVRQEIKR